MKLLDKYILKRFLSTFVFVVLILLAIVTVIDLTEKMDKYARAELSALEILGYYKDFIPWI
ncbi:MAG TPA: LptF/LptG family permease, partial [Cyclobacteriaceae bacterium]